MFEMADYLKSMPQGVLIAIILLLAFVLNGYWKDRKKGLERHDKALEDNTKAILRLQIQLESITQVLTLVPKLKADIDFAHDKIRNLEQRN